jgi:hypothetical protein
LLGRRYRSEQLEKDWVDGELLAQLVLDELEMVSCEYRRHVLNGADD